MADQRPVQSVQPIGSTGGDIEIRDPASGEVLMTWHGLRQQNQKAEANRITACPISSCRKTAASRTTSSAFAVTSSPALSRTKRFEAANDDYSSDHGQSPWPTVLPKPLPG